MSRTPSATRNIAALGVASRFPDRRIFAAPIPTQFSFPTARTFRAEINENH
jgi:hypothetical protein